MNEELAFSRTILNNILFNQKDISIDGTTGEILSNDIDLNSLEHIAQNGIIDLKAQAFDKLMITLEDVMKLDSGKSLLITGTDIDRLIFKDTISEDGTQNIWSSVCEINSDTSMNEYVYTNSGNSSLEVKVELLASDGVTC